mgnify:CR=1 FL=1
MIEQEKFPANSLYDRTLFPIDSAQKIQYGIFSKIKNRNSLILTCENSKDYRIVLLDAKSPNSQILYRNGTPINNRQLKDFKTQQEKIFHHEKSGLIIYSSRKLAEYRSLIVFKQSKGKLKKLLDLTLSFSSNRDLDFIPKSFSIITLSSSTMSICNPLNLNKVKASLTREYLKESQFCACSYIPEKDLIVLLGIEELYLIRYTENNYLTILYSIYSPLRERTTFLYMDLWASYVGLYMKSEEVGAFSYPPEMKFVLFEVTEDDALQQRGSFSSEFHMKGIVLVRKKAFFCYLESQPKWQFLVPLPFKKIQKEKKVDFGIVKVVNNNGDQIIVLNTGKYYLVNLM